MGLPPVELSNSGNDPWSVVGDPGRPNLRAGDDDPARNRKPERAGQGARRRRHPVLKALAIILVVLVMAMLGCVAYWQGTEYRADAQASTSYANAWGATSQGWTTYGDPSSAYGIVFYPGAHVDAAAYAPLMQQLAARGVFCVLVEMPFDLAILNAAAGGAVQEEYPGIEHWYIMGHSLGGAVTSYCVSADPGLWDGVILLAAYPASDISETGIPVLAVVGSEDGVVSWDKIDEMRETLGTGLQYVVIEGGNHAGFGNYGSQDGDGESTISTSEQQAATVQNVLAFMGIGETAGASGTTNAAGTVEADGAAGEAGTTGGANGAAGEPDAGSLLGHLRAA